MQENGEQGFGRLHHVVILLPEQQADPAAQVSGLLQLDTVPPQEAPQVLEIPLHVYTSLQPCYTVTMVNEKY